jgi:hypothetical protein
VRKKWATFGRRRGVGRPRLDKVFQLIHGRAAAGPNPVSAHLRHRPRGCRRTETTIAICTPAGGIALNCPLSG